MKMWKALSDPAKRALVTEVREKVVQRAKNLHSVIAPRALSSSSKAKAVRRLMEKTAFELFDINVVYDDAGLILLVEDIFMVKGGGPEPPFGLLLELDQSFPGSKKRFSTFSLASYATTQGEDADIRRNGNDGVESLDCNVKKDMETEQQSWGNASSGSNSGENLVGIESAASDSVGDAAGNTISSLQEEDFAPLKPATPPIPSTPVDQLRRSSRSLNSLQGYFNTADQVRTARIHGGSRTIASLLHFMPDSALDLQDRKQLTLELLMEMRHAFLTHFAVLIFSELFDEKDKVAYKFEYCSDSDTDDAATDTEVDEDEDEEDGEPEANPMNSSSQ